jgi:DNA-binding transcriptional ArsR family regulator
LPRRAPITTINDPRYVKAVSHPVRVRILAMLDEGRASPKQLSDRLGVSLGVMAYHVRTLYQLDLLKLVGTRQRRGATEHMYEATARPSFSDEAWAAMEPVAKQRLLSAMLRQIGEYANGSAAAGGFDRSDANISRIALKLDERGWKKLAAANKKWLAEVQRIEEDVRKRAAKAGDEHELIDVGLVILLFEALPLSEAPAPRRTASRKRTRGTRA